MRAIASAMLACLLLAPSPVAATGPVGAGAERRATAPRGNVARRASPPSRRTIDLGGAWEFRRVGDAEWLPATVPGVVHLDLLAAGRIDDPFFRDNERRLQWIGRADWEYRRFFDAGVRPGDRADLVFEGLDTVAEVFLNDSLVLSSDVMFLRHRIPCAGLLRERGNELRVRFRSAGQIAEKRWKALGVELPGGPRVTMRKAAYHFGWDWAPRFLTAGIWRPVRLELWRGARIADLRVVTGSISPGRADCAAVVELRSANALEAELVLRIDGMRDALAVRAVSLSAGLDTVTMPFAIDEPRLWWCNGLGEPFLYGARIEARTADGRLLDAAERRFGVRTVELVTDPDEAGESFFFRLNGRPVFAKGANHVPADCFIPRAVPARIEALVDDAAAANMNMLRVWGGGVYEDDAFYDRCDERGILVWQDFMFACAMYPGGDGFPRSVETEAADNIRRLRGHPCIALWCGNNEIAEGWARWGWQDPFDDETRNAIEADYDALFHRLLPEAVRRHHPGAAYVASSPRFGRADPRSLAEGDAHDWGVWHDGEPFARYQERVPRFMSEFGFQSYPAPATVAGFTAPGDRRIDSPVMLAHQKHPRGNELIERYRAMYFRAPAGFDRQLVVSGLLQALGIETAIHAHRRGKPRCMGSLYWQLGDCWPVASWSSVDYHGRWKALHHVARRAFAPVLVSCVQTAAGARVFVVNDGVEPLAGTLRIELVDLAGETLWERRVEIAAGTGAPRSIEVAGVPSGGREASSLLLATLAYPGGTCTGTLWFASPERLDLEAPEISCRLLPDGGGWIAELDAERVARWVEIAGGDVPITLDDNYFDLVPGRPKRVRITEPTPHGAAPPALRITSLWDLTRAPDAASPDRR